MSADVVTITVSRAAAGALLLLTDTHARDLKEEAVPIRAALMAALLLEKKS